MFIKQRNAIVKWAEDHEDLFDDRTAIVTGLYFIGLLVLDAMVWKAIVFAATAYVLMVMKVAPRLVGIVGTAIFFAAVAKWTDIAGIDELAEAARHGLQHLVQH